MLRLDEMRTIWRLALLASLAVLLFGVWFQISMSRHWTPPAALPYGLTNPVLAMQMAKPPWPAAMLAFGDNMAEMTRQQDIDFGYIPSYTALFLCIAILQWHSERGWVSVLAPVCIVLILVAAAFDIAENLAILGVTEHHIEAAWAAIRPRALVKWASAFVVILLQSPFYLTVKLAGFTRLLARALGVASLAAGAVGFLSACTGYERGIELATLPLLLAMLTMPVFLWTGSPRGYPD